MVGLHHPRTLALSADDTALHQLNDMVTHNRHIDSCPTLDTHIAPTGVARANELSVERFHNIGSAASEHATHL